MTTYFSTFISGFTDLIKELLEKQFTDLKIVLLLDGLIVYETAASAEEIQNLRYFNNSFILLNRIDIVPDAKSASIVKSLYLNTDFHDIRKYITSAKKLTFRISISRENQLISIHNEIIKKVEQKIAVETHTRVNRQKGDCEFWFLIRREGNAFLGLRITKLKNEYAKGELREELAHLLCLYSEPNQEDVFLDPHAGSGAIPRERALSFPYKKILAGDHSSQSTSQVKQKLSRIENVLVIRLNALSLKGIADKSIDKIVTDPPWGFYESEELDIESYYTRMIAEFIRVTKKGGIIVVLTGRKDVFEKVIATMKDHVSLLGQLHILVSGKKAGVYKISPLS